MANIVFSESSDLQDSIFGKSQAPIRMMLENKAEAWEQQSLLPTMFSMGKSQHWGEKFTAMTAMSGFQPVGENGEYPLDGMQESYSKFLEHMTWKDSFVLSREIVEDSKIMDLKKKPTAFVNGFYRTREQFGAALYCAAVAKQTTANFGGKKFDVTAADGKCLFDKAHPSILGKTSQSNQFADAFSADALGAAETAMQEFKGDNGEVLGVIPDIILIPNDHELKKKVFAAIGADQDPDTANNGFNYQFGRWTVAVDPYLNQFLAKGSKPWMLLASGYNEEYAGAVWLDRTELDIKSRINDGNDANIWSGYARFTAGFNDWRFACCGGISGGTQLIGG